MNTGSQKAKDKYLKEKVDTFVLRVPKGEKVLIQEKAASIGKSLNSYIVDLIRSDMNGEFIRKEEKQVSEPRRSSLPSFLD
ncbi:MAG: Arc family DNA-binding protein [Clostridia bacterium]|nr:Arc family DNA-binding protein [Clostridia bacterium]